MRNSKKILTMNKSLYEMQAEICSALASPVRIQILDLLTEKEMTSTELQKVLEIPKANLSQHITVLKDAGILHSRKEGLFQYLSLAIPKIKEACQLVRTILIERIEQEERLNTSIIKQLKFQKK